MTSTNSMQRFLPLGAGLVIAVAAPFVFSSPFYLHVANLTLISIVLAASLWLIFSMGQLSLCHGAFAGLGAYISAIVAMQAKVPPLIGIPLSALATGLLAAVLGAVILRVRGVYFVLVTFLFGQVFTLFALNWDEVTHGANGLVNIPPIKLFGLSFASRMSFYYFALVVTIGVLLFIWALMRSPYGRAFRSTAENIQLAESSGIDTSRYQVVAFAIGSGIAGMGGAMLAHYTRFLSPDTFTFHDSIAYITMVVVGGRSVLAGAVLGALFLTPLPEFLRNFAGLRYVIYGSILVAVLIFLPGGLISIGQRARDLIVKLKGAR